jgi:protein-tyrosine phosphatase
MFNRILVLCVGNICRSPTAEYILKQHIKNQGITVSSAGLAALQGKPVDETAQKIALEHGVDMSPHIAQQVNSKIIYENDVILVMQQGHLEDLYARYPEVRGKVFLLGKWIDNAEISDPYRKSDEAFIHVYNLIERACHAWLKYL